MTRALSLLAFLILTTGPAIAQPAPPPEHTAASVYGRPRPGDESGRTDGGERDSTARKLARGVLALPRAAFDLVFTPVDKGVWAFERYHVAERTRRLFFNDAETFCVYPIGSFESDFGVSGGGKLVAGLGLREQLRLQGTFGGRYRHRVAGSVRAYRLDDRLALELRGELDTRPEERFQGIGNLDDAIEARFRQELARGAASADVRVAGDLHVRLDGTVTDLEAAPAATGTDITTVYPMSTLVGFDGYRHLYGEVELAWDSRRRARRWESRSLYATGWLASAFAGRVAMEHGRDFWRYGGDVQHFVRLGTGPRVLALRLHGEAVTGAYQDVPFVELPALGGATLLRGHATERFRDRVAAFGSIEYEWDLARTLFASLFVDAGRVYGAVADVELADLRYGYGAALELHGGKAFWLRGSVASSTDGGVFVNLSFDPVFDVDPRTVRR